MRDQLTCICAVHLSTKAYQEAHGPKMTHQLICAKTSESACLSLFSAKVQSISDCIRCDCSVTQQLTSHQGVTKCIFVAAENLLLSPPRSERQGHQRQEHGLHHPSAATSGRRFALPPLSSGSTPHWRTPSPWDGPTSSKAPSKCSPRQWKLCTRYGMQYPSQCFARLSRSGCVWD